MGGTLKDKITNVVALVMVIGGAINAYFQSLGGGDINYFQLAVVVAGALVAYFTGKDSQGKVKVQ